MISGIDQKRAKNKRTTRNNMKFYIALFAFYTATGFVDAAKYNKRNSSRRVEEPAATVAVEDTIEEK